ncbi:DUF6011 domain-containing protein [Nocardioides sp. NPDC000445]|uniref:DUF6011 domain-containing protein n=1 Tax=Nocardioides sp. NPDC000445 TaxID=3154257 RepID=UPI0033317ACE
MSPGNDRGRPRQDGPTLSNTSDSSVRCWLCGRPLTAESSRVLGIGPKCWADRMGGAA